MTQPPTFSKLDLMKIEDAAIRKENPAPDNYARALLHVIRLVALGSTFKPPLLYVLAEIDWKKANNMLPLTPAIRVIPVIDVDMGTWLA
jgi:DTW domain-containing protein YfiP